MSDIALSDHQETDFMLPNGSVIRVWVTEEGKLKVNAISNGTKISVEPLTQNSLSISGIERK